MYTIGKNNGQIVYGIQHFYADVLEDVSKIPTATLTVGSTVFVIATSTTYMLNHEKKWVKVNLTSNSGGGGGTPSDTYIYEGGELF